MKEFEINLIKFTNQVEKIWNKEIKTVKKHFAKNKDLLFDCDGPNIVFKTGAVQFKPFVYKFKHNTSHLEYKNVIGLYGCIVEFFRKPGIDLKKSIKNIMKQVIINLELAIKDNQFIPEGGCFSNLQKVDTKHNN